MSARRQATATERAGDQCPAGMTRSELLALPVAVDLTTAARALGLGRSTAYELARRREFPCRVLHVGSTYRVPTAELFRVLGVTAADREQEPPAA